MLQGFLLTRPLRDVTGQNSFLLLHPLLSTHTPLAGRDLRKVHGEWLTWIFLLTRPLRDVTFFFSFLINRLKSFLLTRPLRDVTTSAIYTWSAVGLSTHTPLAGRDQQGLTFGIG